MPYISIPLHLVFEDHGYIAGEVWECPQCGKKTEYGRELLAI